MNSEPDLQSPLLHLAPSELYMARENLRALLNAFGPVRLSSAAHYLCRTPAETLALIKLMTGEGFRVRDGGLRREENWLVYREGELVPNDEPPIANS